MKTLHVSGEFGWLYIGSWTIMVSFGYNTSAMAQRYFSVDTNARLAKWLCCAAACFWWVRFLWFIPPMAMRVVYPDLRTVWPSLANPSEGAYAVASLTLLPHGLIGDHVGGNVQRHHGQLVRAVQPQVRDSIQGLVSEIGSERMQETVSY